MEIGPIDSAANDSEKQAVNGSARAILQGGNTATAAFSLHSGQHVTKSILSQSNTVFGMRVYDATGMGFLENW